MITSFEQLQEEAKKRPRRVLAVAQAAEEDILRCLDTARNMGLADFLLMGDRAVLERMAGDLGLPWVKDCIVPAATDAEAARAAVRHVHEGQASTLMKGHLQTGTFLKAVLDKEEGLRAGYLCQCGLYENPLNGRFLLITDCAMNIAPDLMQKKQIVENAVSLAVKLGINTPRVAALAALETVNPDMPETLEAAALSKMAERGQIRGCIVDGPLAMDNAVSLEAALHKGLSGPVAGQADILLVPDLKTGNAVHKTIAHFTGIKNAALCLGALVPIVMTSRTDAMETKVHSIALGCYTA